MFESIIGHDFQKLMFGEGKELRPSYIFEGLEHIGKFTMAKEIGMFYGGVVQNVHIVDGPITVDTIRDVCEQASRFPYLNKHRIVIINNAEQMSAVCQNALLKSLETPAENCCFILVCSDTSALLDTIVSRCAMLKFEPASSELISKVIDERLNITNKELKEFIGVCVRGCVGTVISMEGNTDKYKNVLDIASKLFSTKSQKEFLGISEMFSKDVVYECECIARWCSYLYVKTADRKYLVYANIIQSVLGLIKNGASVSLAVEVMVIRIIKRNEVAWKKSKEEAV